MELTQDSDKIILLLAEAALKIGFLVVSRPDPGGQRIVDVALCRGESRTSVSTRRSRLLTLVITRRTEHMWEFYYVRVSYNKVRTREGGDIPLASA
jgi:hypothetical protein